MRIAGYLSWYDESPHWLATAVSGMARLCDLIVAHDGAYQLFPSARHRSHPQQAEAILQAAEAADAACLIYRPNELGGGSGGNEVEKRSLGLKLVGSLLEPDVDWLLVFDGDFHVMQMREELIRARLAETEHDVATYTVLDGKDLLAIPALEKFAREKWADTEWTIRTRDIYRWTPSLTIGPQHWAYARTDDGVKRWLRGPWDDRLEAALDLGPDLVVYHRNQDRTQVRSHAADVYYQRRAATGLEA